MHKLLKPFAIVTNITQAAHCRLDQVVVTLGYLYFEFLKLRGPFGPTIPPTENTTICTVFLSSLNKRWRKADQLPFIGALIPNPRDKTSLFSVISGYSLQSNVYMLFCTLWSHFFGNSARDGLYQSLLEWLTVTGQFKYAKTWEQESIKAIGTVSYCLSYDINKHDHIHYLIHVV